MASLVKPRPCRSRAWRSVSLLFTLGLVAALAVQFGPSASGAPQRKPATKAAPKKKKPEPPPPVVTRRVTIAKVDPGTRDKVMASAAMIDKLVEAGYARHKVKPNELTTDEQFVRRAYLDITGAIPTYRQVRQFTIARDPDKRSRLIDTLLNTKGYAGNFYNYWSDILRLTERLNNNVPGRPYNEWIKECLETNKPYDKMVYEMLTAEGKVWENPAVGYTLRDAGMPLDAMNNTVRIFLGTQIGCAQCHDHPFDRWTQKEFYEMAAFTFGTQTRRNAADKTMFGGKNVVNKLRQDLKTVDTSYDGGGKYNRFLLGNLMEVYGTGNKLKLPHDYQYDNGKPNQVVTPRTLFEPEMSLKAGESPRVTFAKWVTSKDNPRFALSIANRLWKRLFGIGQIEPVDDIRDSSVPENPELMKFLTDEMIRVKFDLKEYLRIVMNSKTYQRQCSVEEVTPGDTYHFPGPVLRRMSPEQVWDSFITLAVFDPEEYQIEPAKVQAKILDLDLKTATAEQVYKRDQELKEATSSKVRDAREKPYKYKGQLLVRAAELPLPVSPDHFLRQFGQSDHESIEASSRDGSVPQILQMFNGPITHMLLEPKSLMFHNVTSEKTMDERINVIFLSILGRMPDPAERKAAQAEIQAQQNAGYGNVIWSLVNTREFLFIQ